ncbi:MAG: preprotein translocase subunit SecE [Clostridia bacterium]|nr:preprotein translocase subunit SecE [Clostridia bacterium]
MAKEIKKAAEDKAEKKPAKKQSAFAAWSQRALKFFRDCKGEATRVTWPTPKNVFKNMGVVLATVAIVGLFIFALDLGFMGLLGLVMDVAG